MELSFIFSPKLKLEQHHEIDAEFPIESIGAHVRLIIAYIKLFINDQFQSQK